MGAPEDGWRRSYGSQGPGWTAAPMVATKSGRVARGKHGKHGAHGRTGRRCPMRCERYPCVARAEHAIHAAHGALSPTGPDPARASRPIAGRSRLLQRTGPGPPVETAPSPRPGSALIIDAHTLRETPVCLLAQSMQSMGFRPRTGPSRPTCRRREPAPTPDRTREPRESPPAVSQPSVSRSSRSSEVRPSVRFRRTSRITDQEHWVTKPTAAPAAAH